MLRLVNILNFFWWLLQAASIPIILVFVWIFDVRPFSELFIYLDNLLAADLESKIRDKDIPISIYGAIDVALLTFIYNAICKIASKVFRKPVIVSLEIEDKRSNKNFSAIPFDEKLIGMQAPTHLTIKGEIEFKYAKWIFDFILRGIRISIKWHPAWLSVEPQIMGVSKIIKSQPGLLHFNFMDLLSDDEPKTSIEGKLSILANYNFKRDGYIDLKVEINSKYKIVRVSFNWILSLLVKMDLKPCSISLEKGS